MNKLDKQYQELLQTILDYGVEKKDRTGTGTKSIFGYTIRHKMSDGFPLLTTKKMAWKTMVTELLWFLRGDTNIKYLVDNDCHIWDGDAYKRFLNETIKIEPLEVKQRAVEQLLNSKESKEEFINKIKTDDEFAREWGELGPIYGKQWRSWVYDRDMDYGTESSVDQIANLIKELKTNPDSRRLMVSAWNVGELDQMVLPPCHYGFQVYTRELSLEERTKTFEPHVTLNTHQECDNIGLPKRAISLMWNQRSVDTFLGLPFNIASYGLLLEIIAKEVNMVPDELIGNLGDVHLYLNHIEQAKEQIGRELTLEERLELIKDNKDFLVKLSSYSSNEQVMMLCDEFFIPRRTREPFELPKLIINDEFWNPDASIINQINYITPDDFIIDNYKSHPAIKAPLSN